MMAGLLTKAEAERLIEMLKHTVQERMEFPSERGSISFEVVGEQRDDEFVINIDRKGRHAEKCTYQGRVKQNNQVLMRLDIDPTGRHTNPGPDGELITGTHLHIYSEEYGLKYAIPFNVGDKDLFDVCYTFFEKFHIIKPPALLYQVTL